jgi:hypothetical protein
LPSKKPFLGDIICKATDAADPSKFQDLIHMSKGYYHHLAKSKVGSKLGMDIFRRHSALDYRYMDYRYS